MIAEGQPSTLAIGAIAERAGVAEPTVFHHFPTKQDLFRAVAGRQFGQVTAGLDPRAPEDLATAIRTVYQRSEAIEPLVRWTLSNPLARTTERPHRAERLGMLRSALDGVLQRLSPRRRSLWNALPCCSHRRWRPSTGKTTSVSARTNLPMLPPGHCSPWSSISAGQLRSRSLCLRSPYATLRAWRAGIRPALAGVPTYSSPRRRVARHACRDHWAISAAAGIRTSIATHAASTHRTNAGKASCMTAPSSASVPVHTAVSSPHSNSSAAITHPR